MIGPGVPIPVPQEVLDALTSVQVISESGETQSGFELSFTLSTKSPLHTLFLLAGGETAFPIVRVLIIATMNGVPLVLMDGVMTNHDVSPGQDPSQSVYTIKGKDLTALLDF